MHEPTATLSDGPRTSFSPSFGLREGALSPLETLAQSISTIAPSTTPQLTIPLVFVLAGQGTAIAYLIAMGLMVLVGLCIACFARESSSPGSLYVYVRRSLPPAFSAITAWALFFAYISTASAVIGGFVAFAYVFLDPLHARLGLPHIPAIVLVAIPAIAAGFVAYHDVKVSARLMLYIEGASVLLIAIVVATLLFQHGLHFDRPQLTLKAMSPRGIGLGVMLAIFSFVGFESATTLGAEARNPLRTIPRAVIQSALLAGVFFIVAGYGEVLGFRNAATALGDSANPFRTLSAQAGIPLLGPIIDIGVLVSMFAATLACVIAASRAPRPCIQGAHADQHHPRNSRAGEHPRCGPCVPARGRAGFARNQRGRYLWLDGDALCLWVSHRIWDGCGRARISSAPHESTDLGRGPAYRHHGPGHAPGHHQQRVSQCSAGADEVFPVHLCSVSGGGYGVDVGVWAA
jgi:hypothetical protein